MNFASISLKAAQGGNAVVIVIDAKGAVVQRTRKSILAGTNQVMIDTGKLPTGAYTVSVSWGNNVRQAKVGKR